MARVAQQLNAGVLDHSLQGLSEGFWGTLQLRAGCGADRIKKEGRKLPCEPESQPGLLPLACWVGNKQCQMSGDEHKARVVFGRTCGLCSDPLFPEQEMHTLAQQAAPPELTQEQSLRHPNGPSLFSQPTSSVQHNGKGSIFIQNTPQALVWFNSADFLHWTFNISW